MNPADRLEELESLLISWEDGTLDGSGIARVREILRTDEAAREHFVRLQMLNAALQFDDEAGLNPPSAALATDMASPRNAAPAPSPSGTARWRPPRWLFIAAGVLICVLTGRLMQLELTGRPNSDSDVVGENDDRDENREATAQGVALLTQLVDVDWGSDQEPLEVGDALPPGRLTLVSGYAQVEFFCGATVIVEGPADLDLQSPLLARVRSGRLRAHVPPAARGFSLAVDDMTVVDLGTEFGLAISEEGASVQVFDGEVEVHQSATEKRSITAGRALFRDADGTYSETDVTPDDLLDIATLESRAAGQRDQRYQRWRAWSEELRQDTRLIAYYAFDQEGGWQRRLESSLEPADGELDGAIVGAGRVSGRWPAKSGLEFKRPGDRVRVQIPGEFKSLTFACWVKIDSLDRWYNSLFLTDHYNQGEPHWQILDTGQLFFSVRHKPDDVSGPEKQKQTHQPVLSPPFWKPSMSGRWLHLATTYDADAGRTTHYLNGRILHADDIDPALQVRTTRIGAASIGNWSIPTRPDSEFAIRNLNGSIDEFAIFAAALSADEIRKMYENGKP